MWVFSTLLREMAISEQIFPWVRPGRRYSAFTGLFKAKTRSSWSHTGFPSSLLTSVYGGLILLAVTKQYTFLLLDWEFIHWEEPWSSPLTSPRHLIIRHYQAGTFSIFSTNYFKLGIAKLCSVSARKCFIVIYAGSQSVLLLKNTF